MNSLSNPEPKDLANNTPLGFEEPMRKENIIIPRCKLIQGQSPELRDKTLKHIKLGMIINSLTKDEMPPEFVPIFMYSQWLKFNPREDGDPLYAPGALIYRTGDPLDKVVQEEGKFGKDGEKPTITEFLNFFSFFPGSDMPVIVSFCNTSLKAGRELYTLAKMLGGNMFSHQYSLVSDEKSNDKGDFYVLKVRPNGKPADDVYKKCMGLYQAFSPQRGNIQAHEESEE